MELTKKQDLLGLNDIAYGGHNEFGSAECNKLAEHIYFLEIPFSYQGSGMVCKLLIKKEKQKPEIMDFYFGTKDGVDTIAT